MGISCCSRYFRELYHYQLEGGIYPPHITRSSVSSLLQLFSLQKLALKAMLTGLVLFSSLQF